MEKSYWLEKKFFSSLKVPDKHDTKGLSQTFFSNFLIIKRLGRAQGMKNPIPLE